HGLLPRRSSPQSWRPEKRVRLRGVYKLGARYYDTGLGRFTQMDPSGQESNPYAYAISNPINYSDPSGLSAAGVLFDLALVAINAWMDGSDLGDALAGAITPERAVALGWGFGGELLCYAGAAVTGAASVTTGAAGGIAVGLFCTLVGVTVDNLLGG
ncbi:RHS repeat-associated core domain-containing protein, partial [Microbacterium marinilacus]